MISFFFWVEGAGGGVEYLRARIRYSRGVLKVGLWEENVGN